MPYRSHYDPNQPRVPAGHQDGGRWTDDHRGAQPAAGHNGEQGPAAHDDERWPGDYDGDKAKVQLAFLKPAARALPHLLPRLLAGKDLAAGLEVLSALSLLNNDYQRAVAEFKIGEYNSDNDSRVTFVDIRLLKREELEKVCKRIDQVQKITDMASEQTKTEQPGLVPSVHGTAVHTRVQKFVEAVGDPDFVAERRFDDVQSNKDGTSRRKFWIRVDILEFPGNKTACVYDVKTGDAKLDKKRMDEIAEYVLKRDPSIDRLFVIQVKPRIPRPK